MILNDIKEVENLDINDFQVFFCLNLNLKLTIKIQFKNR